MVNCLRYHPVPPVVNPPLTWLMADGLNGDFVPGRSSILQSCGKSSLRHLESSNLTFSAPCAPPRKKSQLLSNNSVAVFCGNAAAESSANRQETSSFLYIEGNNTALTIE